MIGDPGRMTADRKLIDKWAWVIFVLHVIICGPPLMYFIVTKLMDTVGFPIFQYVMTAEKKLVCVSWTCKCFQNCFLHFFCWLVFELGVGLAFALVLTPDYPRIFCFFTLVKSAAVVINFLKVVYVFDTCIFPSWLIIAIILDLFTIIIGWFNIVVDIMKKPVVPPVNVANVEMKTISTNLNRDPTTEAQEQV